MSKVLARVAFLCAVLAVAVPTHAQVCSLVAAASPTSLPQGATLNASWLGFGCASFTGYSVDLNPAPVGFVNPILQGGATPPDVQTTWVVPECLPPNTYYLHVTQGTTAGQTGANTNNFAVTAGPVPCVYWAKAGSGGGGVNPVVVPQGGALPITWSSQNQSRYELYLHYFVGGAPVDLSAFAAQGGTANGRFLAGTGAAQAANFTPWANVSPLPSVPVGRYKVRVVVYRSDNTFREMYTNWLDVTPTIGLGNVTATPSPVQVGSPIVIGWGQRNQARYQVRVDGTTIAGPTNGTTTSQPYTIPTSFAGGSHTASVTIWDAANHTLTASTTFTVQAASVAWTAASVSVPETGGSVTLTARLTTSPGATLQPVVATYASANGTAAAGLDYTGVSGSVTFPAGSTSGVTRTVTVPILDDVIDEPDETFTVALNSATNAIVASPSVETVTIVDNDPPVTFSVGNAQVTETNTGTPALQFMAYRTPDTPATVTVNFATAPGTAGTGDFIMRSGTITFGPGNTSQPVFVSVVADTIYEGNEAMALNLSGPVGGVIGSGQGTGTGTILDDDPLPTMSVGDVSTSEGSGAASFPVTLSNRSQFPVTVTYSTADGSALAASDYTAVSGTLTIPALASSASVSVPVTADAVYERDEDFVLNLGTATGGTVGDGQGRAVVGNDDAAPTLAINDVSVVEGNGGTVPLTLTVTLSGATEVPASVTCATSDVTAVAGVDFQATSQVLSFPAGTTTRTCPVQVVGDTAPEGDEVLNGLLSAPADATVVDGAGIGRILDDDRTGNPAPRADFNADGKTDLLFRNLSSGNHVVWFMDGLFKSGGTLFTPAKPADGNWYLVGAADFDPALPGGDLLWQNTDSGNLALWRMNGASQASGAVIPGIGVEWKLVATTDFNADGKPDYFWRNTTTAETRVWFMDGTLKLGEASPTPASLPDLGWVLGAAGDLDGNGSPDLVWRNQTSGNVVVWRMAGTDRIEGVVLGPVPLPWQIVGIWDVDLDGHADLVWQEQTTSTLLTWFMNGLTVVGSSVFSPERQVDPNWRAVGPR